MSSSAGTEASSDPGRRHHAHHGGHDHGGHGHGDHSDVDWAAMGERLEAEADLTIDMLRDAVAWTRDASDAAGLRIGAVVDVGSGPGVAACELAGTFTDASVVAVDQSRELLAMAERRIERLGLGDRVTTRVAALQDGVAAAGDADLVWASMVLHHLDDPAGALGRLRDLLRPGGMIVLTEWGDPTRCIPAEVGVGRAGLAERVERAAATWIATMGSNGHEGSPPSALPGAFAAAGLEVAAEHLVDVRIAAPLPDEARRIVAGFLTRMADTYTDLLDEDDRDALRQLADPESPNTLLTRADAFYATSRHLYLLRPA